MRVAVLTIDQRRSSSRPDRVPEALRGLDPVVMLRRFERTAGDEFQGVLDEPGALAQVVEHLLRAGDWSIGIGIGDVEHPLPQSTRAGRGPAFLHARDAVTSAKNAPARLRVVSDHERRAKKLETVLWLWAAILDRRTKGGWEVADLADTGLRYDAIAERLGITQSAVSQRAAAAGIIEGRRARELVTDLVGDVLQDDPS